MRLFQILLIAAVCSFVGLSVFLYKVMVLEFPLQSNEQTRSWHLEATMEFTGRGKPVKAQLFLPRPSSSHSIVDENFISNGYGFSSEIEKERGNRVAQWTKRKVNGRDIIFYRAILYETSGGNDKTDKPRGKAVTYKDKSFRKRAELDPAFLATSNLIEELWEISADDASFTAELLKVIRDGQDERVTRIQEDIEGAQGPASMASFVLNSAGIPARVVNGIRLEDRQQRAALLTWIEIYSSGEWLPVDLKTGLQDEHGNLLRWWIGSEPIYSIEGVSRSNVNLSVKQHMESALTEAIWKGNKTLEALYDISVFSLPIDLQLVFAVLFLVPVGSLVSSFLRQIIGVSTFGVFMPVLVALAFRETQLLAGIVMFSLIVTIGMVFRSYFDRLQLLMAPRLGAVLTIVVIIIYALSLITFKLGINAGLSISLFPMVILTMMIERMSVMAEESGLNNALKAAAGSLFVAICAYLVMNNDAIGYLIVTFPELLLVVLSLHILLGRYNGYKLTEYYRFRALRKAGNA